MRPLSYAGYRFPPEIIQHAIWLYLRFTLSFRDVEELLAVRGIDVSHETIRRWVAVFGPMIARRLRAMRPSPIRLGISMRCSSRLVARECICGEPSMRKAKCSIALCNRAGTSEPHC